MKRPLTFHWQVTFAVMLLVLGVILSVQFKTQKNISTSLEYQSTDSLVAMWKELSTKQDRLQAEISDLKDKESKMAAQAAEGKNNRINLEQDLIKLQSSCGLIPVKGPGIIISLAGDAPLLYLDLVDLVNELWASGAEAVSIDNRRVTAHTSISENRDGDSYYLTVDGHRLHYPITIKAVGNPDTLEKGLTFTGGLVDNFNTLYGIYPDIQKRQEIVLPAAKAASWKFSHQKQASPPAPAQ